MKKTIDFYFLEDNEPPNLASLEIDGIRHFSSDIRTSHTNWAICTSKKTLPSKYNNQEEVDALLNKGIYIKKSMELDTETYPDYITHTTFKNPF